MNYTNVYKMGLLSTDVPFVVVGPILLVIGLLFYRFMRSLRGRALFMMCGGLLFTAISIDQLVRAATLKKMLEEHRCTVVEGVVEQFHPGSRGRDFERFEIAGEKFEFSEHEMRPGYRRYYKHGGQIGPGMRVRLCHAGSIILSVDVADGGQ